MADELYVTSSRGGSTGAVALTLINNLLRATGQVGSSAGSAALTLINNLLRATASTGGSTGTIALTPSSATVPVEINAAAEGTHVRAALTLDGQAMTLRDLVNLILSLWGRGGSCLSSVDGPMQMEILACVHWGLQVIYTRAHTLDYFNRGTITATIAASENSVALPDNIQTLLGPVRLEDGTALIEVRHRHEFDQWLELAYGGSAHAPDEPRAYHLLKNRQLAAEGVALTLMVTPAPTEETDFLLDVATEPPRYTWQAVVAAVPLQLPHRYAESLLVPLVLKTASRYRHFTRREMQPQIDESHAVAIQTLGLADPKTPTTEKLKAES